MPKMKTHKGTKKRVKVTAKGKYISKKSGKSHILTKKDAKRKKRLGQDMEITGGQAKKVARLLPTGEGR